MLLIKFFPLNCFVILYQWIYGSSFLIGKLLDLWRERERQREVDGEREGERERGAVSVTRKTPDRCITGIPASRCDADTGHGGKLSDTALNSTVSAPGWLFCLLSEACNWHRGDCSIELTLGQLCYCKHPDGIIKPRKGKCRVCTQQGLDALLKLHSTAARATHEQLAKTCHKNVVVFSVNICVWVSVSNLKG